MMSKEHEKLIKNSILCEKIPQFTESFYALRFVEAGGRKIIEFGKNESSCGLEKGISIIVGRTKPVGRYGLQRLYNSLHHIYNLIQSLFWQNEGALENGAFGRWCGGFETGDARNGGPLRKI